MDGTIHGIGDHPGLGVHPGHGVGDPVGVHLGDGEARHGAVPVLTLPGAPVVIVR